MPEALPVTVTVRRLLADARTVTERAAVAPAATAPTVKHAVRPDLLAPLAFTIARPRGAVMQEVTPWAAVPPVLATRSPILRVVPLVTRARDLESVAVSAAGVAAGAAGAAHAALEVWPCRNG